MEFPLDRAGIYKKHKDGHRTFIPKPLPPTPPIELDNRLMNTLSKADQTLGRLEGVSEILPDPDLFVMMYIKKEAVLSSQIEGTQASLIDVLEFEAQTLDPESPTDVEEVVNYIKAMNYGLVQIKAERKITIDMVKKIHYHLLQETRGREMKPGNLRTVQNWIGPPNCTIADATYIPPDKNDMKIALKDLETFIIKEKDLPPLLKVGMVHCQFETIHPFIDGNGRVGRLLITLQLAESKYLSRPLLYLSYYFKQNRAEYYDRLQAVRDSGKWEQWLDYFLKGILRTSSNAIDTSMKIIELRKEVHESLTMQFGNKIGSALKLFDTLFHRPIVTIRSVAEITGLSYPNASQLTTTFEKLGVLKEVTGQKRNRVYEFVKYMDILNEGI